MTAPVWAGWAAYQWATGRAQRYIARDLGLSLGTTCAGISRFVTDAYPELANGEEIYGGAARRLNVYGDDRKELVRRYFSCHLAPERPILARTTAEDPPRANRWGPFGRDRRLGRVFDPDEWHAPRDVWLTYLPSPDPRFDNMVPVVWPTP